MIFLDTTYLLGIQLSDRMLFDVEERRQGILYMRNDLLHEILGDDDEDPGHVLATFHVLDDLIGQGQYEMVFPYDIFLHIDPYTHEAFRAKREYDGVYSHRMVERGNIVDVIEYGEILVDEIYAGYVLDKRDTSLR